MHIRLTTAVVPSFRVEQVRGMFDLPRRGRIVHEWDVTLPLGERRCVSATCDWQIGLIVGPSGSGKTTLGRRLFPRARFHTGYRWPKRRAIVDAFPSHLSARDITQALSSVGFSSPPHWLKPFDHLSTGQKFRCELARVLLEDVPLVVFDEYTSVVDRDAAKVTSAAVAKALRQRGRPRLVALSCHYDIIDWLNPDWVYNTADGSFARRRLRRRPPLTLRIHPASAGAWPLFRGHHYLSAGLHPAARCFVACWNGVPVAFTSFLPMQGRKGVRREHRTVVLPDYQGVGIGNALSEWLGAWLAARGLRFWSVTSHPAMIRHRAKSPRWQLRRFGHVRGGSSAGRLTASFEFVT
jgi:GNAT superfamily N-acetyltransferase